MYLPPHVHVHTRTHTHSNKHTYLSFLDFLFWLLQGCIGTWACTGPNIRTQMHTAHKISNTCSSLDPLQYPANVTLCMFVVLCFRGWWQKKSTCLVHFFPGTFWLQDCRCRNHGYGFSTNWTYQNTRDYILIFCVNNPMVP